MSSKYINILNLIVIGIAIIAIIYFIIKMKQEGYAGLGYEQIPLGLQQGPPPPSFYQQNQYQRYPQTIQPLAPNIYPITNQQQQGSALRDQPLSYDRQLYPKIPYYQNTGQQCSIDNGCGPMASCNNGICIPNTQSGTVFGL